MERADELLFGGVAPASFEEVWAEILVRVAACEEVVGDDEDGVSDSDGRALRAASDGDAAVAGAEIRASGAAGGMGGLDERASEGEVALRVLPLRRLPPLSWLPGQRPA